MGWQGKSPQYQAARQREWDENARIEKEAAESIAERKRFDVAQKIVMMVVNKITNDLIRPGPVAEERECYEMAQELLEIKPALTELVRDILYIDQTEPAKVHKVDKNDWTGGDPAAARVKALEEALTDAIDNLATTCRGSFFGWECTENGLLSKYRAALTPPEVDAELVALRKRYEGVTPPRDEQSATILRLLDRLTEAEGRAELAEKHRDGYRPHLDQCEQIAAKDAEIERLKETLVDTTAHLAAAISLLERSSKKAAPSDKMFDQMLSDYRASLKRARNALTPNPKDLNHE